MAISYIKLYILIYQRVCWLEGNRRPRNIATTATTMDRVCSPHQSPGKTNELPMWNMVKLRRETRPNDLPNDLLPSSILSFNMASTWLQHASTWLLHRCQISDFSEAPPETPRSQVSQWSDFSNFDRNSAFSTIWFSRKCPKTPTVVATSIWANEPRQLAPFFFGSQLRFKPAYRK